MGAPKFSIVIPYKQRLDNVRLALAALAEQTMDRSEFEVVVGALEYSPEFTAVCEEFSDRLDIITVMSGAEWNLCHARNLALRQISGQVLVVLDADMVVPSRFLENLYTRYFQHGQKICVVGQMIGYDDVIRRDVESVEVLPFSDYRKVLAKLETEGNVQLDSRWTPEYASAFARFPWVYACGALVAVPAEIVKEHGLTYEEGFRGWGPEDQEWARRVSRTGTPIVLGEGVYGVHLPHPRNQVDQSETEIVNWRYYLAKWPVLDVEMAIAYEQLEADRLYPDAEREVAAAVPVDGQQLGVVRGTVNGRSVLVVGAAIDSRTHAPAPSIGTMFDDQTPREVLPLAGLALPYPDQSIDECRVLPPVLELSTRFRDTILKEAERVALKLVDPVAEELR
ncbi:glycosyltransferase [Streptomyces sp. NBC_01451]|uniref:glycosyltransferase n=1 Tax=Streptomyces sp. NBC_01451 TaxID=2903872 RepID=UPI002E362112|nr:glycosyltransferase family 2 protein [Streptomyces sp. NBC_01451]